MVCRGAMKSTLAMASMRWAWSRRFRSSWPAAAMYAAAQIEPGLAIPLHLSLSLSLSRSLSRHPSTSLPTTPSLVSSHSASSPLSFHTLPHSLHFSSHPISVAMLQYTSNRASITDSFSLPRAVSFSQLLSLHISYSLCLNIPPSLPVPESRSVPVSSRFRFALSYL